MLQFEPVSTRIDQPGASRHDPSPTPGVSSSVSGSGIPNHRFPSFNKFEQELTFTPKLNATSLKLAHERRTQLKSGIVHRGHARVVLSSTTATSPHHHAAAEDKSLPGDFTFKPQMSTASLKIAENLGTTFMARQELHLQKQRQKLEQSTKLPLRGRLSPVIPSIAKARRLSIKEKENEENSQVAWSTPSSTPNLIDSKENVNGDAAAKRLIAGSTPTLLSPVKPGRGSGQMQTSVSFNKLQDSMYAQPTTSMSLRRQKTVMKAKGSSHKRGVTYPAEGRTSQSEDDTEGASPIAPPPQHHRSKTNASPELSPRSKARNPTSRNPNGDRLRMAKLTAEKAMKMRKIFTIQGPYPVVRASLRRRAWVEKQYRLMNPHKFKKKNNGEDDSDSDDDDDIDDDNTCDDDNDDSMFDDTDGLYGIMSRIVRNSTPTFIWTVKKGSVDYRFLRKETIVNHFCKNGTFTTKVGLCTNLKNLHWFNELDADVFFPRCYRICVDEEKDAFVDDYRLSAAIGVLKWIVLKQDGDLDIDLSDVPEEDKTKKEEEEKEEEEKDKEKEQEKEANEANGNNAKSPRGKKKPPVVLGTPFVDVAIKIVEDFLTSKEHEDIDEPPSAKTLLTEAEWDKFIQEYYSLTSEGGKINDTTTHYAYCDSLLNRLRAISPQIDMGGFKNIWIVKPGAKSRGRGIMCMNKLAEILKLIGNPLVKKEGKWVVQKYIERPLLIYQTKFDIRQWFLVTDWNPLTIWWYDACYLRFCTQPFSLDSFDSSIHLSNQSIQKFYENSPKRDKNLPEDNMWDSSTFRKYLDDRGFEGLYEDVIVPGMKKAILSSMLCAQDVMEARKNSFELYGADFMLTDDFIPWMLEINASPAMGATSPVTEQLCANVIEDTMKVVLDRKHDKNCDTGRFSILYKGPNVTVPPYVGAALCVDGSSLQKPVGLNRQKSTSNVLSPRHENDKKAEVRMQKRSKTPGKADKMAAIEKLGLKAGVTPKATSMDDMKKKLAGSSLEVSWGHTCALCGNGPGYVLDTSNQVSDQVCDCQRGSLVVPDPTLDESPPTPRPTSAMLRLTVSVPRPPSSKRSRPPSTATTPHTPATLWPQCTSSQAPMAAEGMPRPPSAMSMKQLQFDQPCEVDAKVDGGSDDNLNDPIPRAINFISNAVGQLITISDQEDLQGALRPSRVGFSQGRTRPNVNRQRRENKAHLKASKQQYSLGPMRAVVTNSRK
ncbi:uncharacterized protein [Diadema setosum]|uniref:uncharacterized protein isoform X2 n=1 Tax=Diadema setosum TaxID=31175 RepID=UPI003B3BCF05